MGLYLIIQFIQIPVYSEFGLDRFHWYDELYSPRVKDIHQGYRDIRTLCPFFNCHKYDIKYVYRYFFLYIMMYI